MAELSAELKKHLYVVVLCGGGGTRLWPLSREKTPKQFIRLISRETLFERTMERVRHLVSPEQIVIITNVNHQEEVSKYAADVPRENVIIEPKKKNTALAMGVASAYIHKRDPEAVVINIASDHLIENGKLFLETITNAAQAAMDKEHLVSVGINPTFPHTGLGYIKVGNEVNRINSSPVLRVLGFTEKPHLAKAQAYLATGQYFWNANLYTWSTAAVLREFEKHSPVIYQHIANIMAAVGTPQEKEVLQAEYEKSPDEQIDTAISEKTSNLLMIPGDFDWNDVGAWNVVYDIVDKDDAGNAFIKREDGATWYEVDTRDSLVNIGNKTVVTIGVQGLIIVDTPDALLIMPKERSQDVKKAVDMIKKDKREDLL